MGAVEDIIEIFGRITEEYERPVPIGGRCESNIYYRVENLDDASLNLCADYVADRIISVCGSEFPDLILKLPGGFSFFAERLAAVFSELHPQGKEVKLEQYLENRLNEENGGSLRGRTAVLVTDVITTARSSLEAHTRATLKGITILCWASLIDRTFGPGPVPVVSAFTGAPVRVLTQIG